jgi:hypothetical protein
MTGAISTAHSAAHLRACDSDDDPAPIAYRSAVRILSELKMLLDGPPQGSEELPLELSCLRWQAFNPESAATTHDPARALVQRIS